MLIAAGITLQVLSRSQLRRASFERGRASGARLGRPGTRSTIDDRSKRRLLHGLCLSAHLARLGGDCLLSRYLA